jgi:N-acetylneuraminic acid mutarotase
LAANTWGTKRSGFSLSYANGVGKLGNKLYISGGYEFEFGPPLDETRIRASVYAYDPARDLLIRKRDMPRATAEGVSGVIDGKLYVLAGACLAPEGLVVCRSLYRYDPGTNAWTTLAPAPRSHRGGAGGVIAGKFYVAGGVNGTRLDVYDPVTNKWTARAPLPQARGSVAGTVLGSRLYVIGGTGPSGHRIVFAYNPGTNTWTARAPLNAGRSGLAAARVTLDGKSYILAVGGNTDIGGDSGPGDGPNELYTP